MDENMELEEEAENKRPGSILKIHMKNFVTYTKASISMGQHFNLLIGPNGTGKSTIVAAIILGLGGTPKQVGRGSRVCEYVKHGCQESKIDITLYDPSISGKKFTITREFNINNNSIWKIDGRKVSLNDVNEYKNKFNIQVDNLCQFLPQDRVQEFAKLNKQELLVQTEMALCRADLTEKRDTLVKTMEDFNNSNKNLEKNIERLQNAKDANMRLEGKVKNFEKKKKYLGYIKDIDRKVAWKEYEEVNLKRNEVKEDRSKAKELLNNRKKEIEPKQNEVKALEKSVEKLTQKIETTEKIVKSSSDNIRRITSQIASIKEEINHQERNMASQLEELRQRDKEIQSYSNKIQALNADKTGIITKYGSEEELVSLIKNQTQVLGQIMGELNHIDNKRHEFAGLKRQNMYERQPLENQIRSIENVKDQRLEFLRRYDPGTYQAVIWLRQNKQEFIGQVYEPMILELNVIDPKHALYIENVIAKRDKTAFVCTEKQDMNHLIRVLRDQQNFSVNVLHSDDRDDQSLSIYKPRIPIEQLHKYGMFAYLNTLITAPRPIMKYLCKNNSIHQIPVGNESTNNYFESIPKEVRLFFSDKNRFAISYSKYTNQKISKQDRISSDGSFSISVDSGKLAEIRNKLEEYKQTYAKIVEEEKVIGEKVGKVQEKIDKQKEALNVLKQAHNNLRVIENKIRSNNQMMEQFQNDTTTIDSIQAETKQKNKELAVRMKEALSLLTPQMKNFQGLEFTECLTDIKRENIKDEILSLNNEIINMQDACANEQQLFDDLTTRFNTLTEQAKTLLQNAKKLSNGFTPADEGFQEFREMYDKFPDEVDQLMAEKETLQNKIGCLNPADADEMNKYKERLKLIEQLEETIQNTTKNADLVLKRIDTLEREYLDPLEDFIGRINEKFQSAYERMGCAGEVSIYKGEKPKDYSNYGISIKVSYRNGEPLQELNSLTQSGGEKAVATATYMLSLQELTPVPFRCVDEINQGMDETNERRIFRLLTELTSQPHTAQYIFVTPKLIPKLNYVPTMKIHCVYSGRFLNMH